MQTLRRAPLAAGLERSQTAELEATVERLVSEGVDVCRLGLGEPDIAVPQHVRDAAIRAIRDNFSHYTSTAGIAPLRAAIAARLRDEIGVAYDASEVIVSNGGKHAIFNALAALLAPGDEVLIPVPYWVSFPQQVRFLGAVPVFVPASAENDYRVTASDIERHVTPRTRVLILNSPNNPSGAVYSREEISALAAFVRSHDLFVLADEIYETLVYGDARHVSIASLGPELRERTVLVNGVSKTWAMTGWRVGYAAAPADLAESMERLQGQMTSNPAAVSQQAALRALTGDAAPARAMRAEFEARRDLIVRRLRAIEGFELTDPEGAFYAFPDASARIHSARNGVHDSVSFCDYLIDEAKIVCVPGSAFGMEGHLRISYAVSERDIQDGLDRMEAALERM